MLLARLQICRPAGAASASFGWILSGFIWLPAGLAVFDHGTAKWVAAA
jgi:hypothetical protein